MSDREALAIPTFDGDDDLDDFAPRDGRTGQQVGPAPQPARRTEQARRAVDAVSNFPSREASADGQLNLKGPLHVLERFKAICKADRRAYYDMLEILMDRFEGK